MEIDGKTHAEILAMSLGKRKRWYKTLAPIEREFAMEHVETARRAKLCAAMSGEGNPNFGKTVSEETRTKMSVAQTGRVHSEETRAKIRTATSGENNHFFGKTRSKETRAKISAAKTGENHPRFNNWSSREPYCHLWTEEVRESIRNRDERRCQSCGKPEILDGRRLSVHHIDGDKMQGCGKRWALVTLCNSCNTKADTVEKEFLIVSNLNLTNKEAVLI